MGQLAATIKWLLCSEKQETRADRERVANPETLGGMAGGRGGERGERGKDEREGRQGEMKEDSGCKEQGVVWEWGEWGQRLRDGNFGLFVTPSNLRREGILVIGTCSHEP